jgi:hypothetical protein
MTANKPPKHLMASALIAQLQKLISKNGDCKMVIYSQDLGFELDNTVDLMFMDRSIDGNIYDELDEDQEPKDYDKVFVVSADGV